MAARLGRRRPGRDPGDGAARTTAPRAGGGALRRYAGAGKYGIAPKAERTFRGRVYPSKAEAAYAAELELMRRARLIRAWTKAKRIPLVVNGLLVGHYTPDFDVERADGVRVVVEVKGAWSEAARLRVKLARACDPKLQVVCVRREWSKFHIIPTPAPEETVSIEAYIREDLARANALALSRDFFLGVRR